MQFRTENYVPTEDSVFRGPDRKFRTENSPGTRGPLELLLSPSSSLRYVGARLLFSLNNAGYYVYTHVELAFTNV